MITLESLLAVNVKLELDADVFYIAQSYYANAVDYFRWLPQR